MTDIAGPVKGMHDFGVSILAHTEEAQNLSEDELREVLKGAESFLYLYFKNRGFRVLGTATYPKEEESGERE